MGEHLASLIIIPEQDEVRLEIDGDYVRLIQPRSEEMGGVDLIAVHRSFTQRLVAALQATFEGGGPHG